MSTAQTNHETSSETEHSKQTIIDVNASNYSLAQTTANLNLNQQSVALNSVPVATGYSATGLPFVPAVPVVSPYASYNPLVQNSYYPYQYPVYPPAAPYNYYAAGVIPSQPVAVADGQSVNQANTKSNLDDKKSGKNRKLKNQPAQNSQDATADEDDDDPTVDNGNHKTKANNVLPFWGNEKTMNLNPLILTNIQNSPYFKNDLYQLKTYHEVIDEIYYSVKHLEPWERGSRKVSGQTGMCGSVRGVGAGGIVSTPFCLLYKLYTLKLTRKQLTGLLKHKDSPYIRALGFMYIRFTQPPSDFWKWFEPYLEDDEEFEVKSSIRMTIGELCRQMITKLDWFSTLFPRMPIPVQKDLERLIREYDQNKKKSKSAHLEDGEVDEDLEGRKSSFKDQSKYSSSGTNSIKRSRSRSRERRKKSRSKERRSRSRSRSRSRDSKDKRRYDDRYDDRYSRDHSNSKDRSRDRSRERHRYR